MMVLTVGLIVAFVVSRMPRLRLWMRIGIVAVYAVIVLIFGMGNQYPDSPIGVETVADVEAVMNNGRTTFVMLYSNY